MPQLGSVCSELVELKHIKNRGLGAKPNRWAIFVIFQKKNSHFNVIRIKFRIFLEPFKKRNRYNLKAI